MKSIYGFTFLTDEEIDSWYSKKSKDMSKKEIKRDANGRFAKSRQAVCKPGLSAQEYVEKLEKEKEEVLLEVRCQIEEVRHLRKALKRQTEISQVLLDCLPFWIKRKVMKKIAEKELARRNSEDMVFIWAEK